MIWKRPGSLSPYKEAPMLSTGFSGTDVISRHSRTTFGLGHPGPRGSCFLHHRRVLPMIMFMIECLSLQTYVEIQLPL
jgi:hypothetical protein